MSGCVGHDGPCLLAVNDKIKREARFRKGTMRRIALGAVTCLLLAIAWAVPVAAVEPEAGWDAPLVPLDSPGFVELISYTVDAEVVCQDGDSPCALRVRQVCQLHNRDRIEAHVIRVGVPLATGLADPSGRDLRLLDADGQALPRAATTLGARASIPSEAAWEVSLGRNEKRTLVLEYTRPSRSLSFIEWRSTVSQLSAWGGLQGIRVAFHLPFQATDDVLLEVAPADYRIVGTAFVWDDVDVQYPSDVSLVLYAPPVWRQLWSLENAAAHADLADLLLTLWAEAQEESIPFADPFDRVVAELQAAPGDAESSLQLAEAYRQRAEENNSLRLNYLILSAQQLAQVVQLRPSDAQVADLLSKTYYEAALTAIQDGDPAGALSYLKKAGEVSGVEGGQAVEKQEDLILRWALDLAEQGLVDQALAQLSGMLTSETENAILRYSPPFASVRTIVTLHPAEREVQYEFGLYRPSVPKTYGRLQDLAGRMELIGEARVALHSTGDAALLRVSLPYASLEELAEESAKLALVLAEDPDLTSIVIAAPWESLPGEYHVETNLWRTRIRYRESVDAQRVWAQWKEESQYIGWRLIELRGAEADTERAQIEKHLTQIVLRDQRLIWEHLASGSYTAYSLPYESAQAGAEDPDAVAPRWIVPWGEQKELAYEEVVYHWARAWQARLLAALLLVLLVIPLIALTVQIPGRRRG